MQFPIKVVTLPKDTIPSFIGDKVPSPIGEPRALSSQYHPQFDRGASVTCTPFGLRARRGETACTSLPVRVQVGDLNAILGLPRRENHPASQ